MNLLFARYLHTDKRGLMLAGMKAPILTIKCTYVNRKNNLSHSG